MMIQNTVENPAYDASVERRIDAEFKGLLTKIAFALLSALLSRTVLPGGYSPFGAGFMAAVPLPYTAVSVVGGVIGCLTDQASLASSDMLRHLSVILAIGGIRWALGELKQVNQAEFYPFFAAVGGVLLTNAVISGTAGSLLSYSSLFFALEGFMAGICAMLFAGASKVLSPDVRPFALSRETTVSLILLWCAAMIPLCQWFVFGISPGMILLHTAVLLVLPSKRELGGALSGIAAGGVSVLAQYGTTQGAICPVAALLAGYMAAYGRIFAASTYLAVCLMGSLAAGNMHPALLVEIAIAGVLSCLIPPAFAEQALEVCGFGGGRVLSIQTTDRHAAVTNRLQTAADALTGISSVVEQVSDKLSRMYSPEPEAIYRRSLEKVCAGCPRLSQCRRTQKCNGDAFDRLSTLLKSRGSVSGADISDLLMRKCPHESELAGEITARYGYYIASQSAHRRIAQVRSVISDQLEGMGLMLHELSEEIGTTEREDEEAVSKLTDAFQESGYTVKSAHCTTKRSGGLTVVLRLRASDHTALEREEMGDYVGEILGCTFNEPTFDGSSIAFTVTLEQKQRFGLSFAGVQHCCEGELLCGDAYDAFTDGDGYAYMLLSDGMGSGGRAAVDGAMACGLLSRLLAGGFGWDSAVKLVNSSLLIKSEEESLSTIDSLQFNLYSGRATFCKAGAAQSYHVRDGVVSRIDIESLPLGILRETDTAQYALYAEDGDLIVMLSDGVPTDETMWFEHLLQQYGGEPIEDFAKFLLDRAVSHRPSGEDDDITVMIGQIAFL